MGSRPPRTCVLGYFLPSLAGLKTTALLCRTMVVAFSLLLVSLLAASPSLAAGIYSTLSDAQKQFEQAHYDQALKLYQQANEAEPGHAAIEYNMGLCQLYLGDGDKAIQQFETLASRGEVNRSLRCDAFYNAGLIRARSASGKLKQLFAPATQPTDHKPSPDDPANISKLQAIADELLRSISAFRKSDEAQASADAEHNIRAVRIMRRDVLGLLRKASQAKQKDDMLKDPRAYLEALILEQERQAALGRLLTLAPPTEAAQVREARRAGLRAQRKIMENTGEFADELSQFREKSDNPKAAASAPSSRPAEQTPREKVYRAAAKQLNTAVETQKDACAFLLDSEVKAAHEKQTAAVDQLYTALYMFPLDPGQTLIKARQEQAGLRDLVDGIKAGEDWQRDPMVPDASVPKDMKWEADQAPIHVHQARVGAVLSLLLRQCQHVAATSQPAKQAQGPEQPKNPMVDPELNRKLADALKDAPSLAEKIMAGISAQDRKATLSAQDELLKMIDAAIDLLPKTIEQRITELIVRQSRLNQEVQAEAGEPGDAPKSSVGTALDDARKWAIRLKSRLLGKDPSKLADGMSGKQKNIRTDTVAVNEEVKKKIPAGAGAQANASPAASQPAELKAYIEASKHLVESTRHMDAGLEGFDQAVVENSLRPMQPGGPVQDAQGKALEELVKALAALKPPATQPSQDQNDKNNQQQQEQAQEKQQDKQRELDRMDKERERAEQQLYQRRPRTVIKDW